MNAATLNGFTAAATVLKWLRAWHGMDMPEAIDLDIVRQMLPSTPYGKGVREIKAPMALQVESCEGMLVRNPNDAAEWGIFYSGKSKSERRRFTIAHELGHFVLHRAQQEQFNCDKESVHAGIETLRAIERAADDFAGNLLMPGDVLRQMLDGQRVDLHLLSAIAKRFQVSFEALCIRYIKYTEQRAILAYWDNGFLKYEWRSDGAVRTRAHIRRTGDPQEPLPGTLAADGSTTQEWRGADTSASLWCSNQTDDIALREFKHTYAGGNRVLSLLILESAPPRTDFRSGWEDESARDTFDQFHSSGQLPVR